LEQDIPISNREMVERLARLGIGCRTFFWCMHEQPVYVRDGYFHGEKYANAEYLARKGFYIPSGIALTQRQMETVVEKLKQAINEI